MGSEKKRGGNASLMDFGASSVKEDRVSRGGRCLKKARHSLFAHERRRTVTLGNATLTMDKNLIPLKDSTDLFQKRDFAALRSTLLEDGVILIRNVIPREKAIAARAKIVEHVSNKGAIDTEKGDLIDAFIAKEKARFVDGWTVDAQTGGCVGERDDDVKGWESLGNESTLTDIYDGKYLRELYSNLFQSVRTFPCNTWIRLKARGDVTIEHSDYYYFTRNTDMIDESTMMTTEELLRNRKCYCCGQEAKNFHQCVICKTIMGKSCIVRSGSLYEEGQFLCKSCADAPIPYFTCWISLSEVAVENSTLGFVLGSHKLTGFDRPKPGHQVPFEFENLRKAAKWSIPDSPLQPGDILLFNIKTIHAASKNISQQFRISFDTRLNGI